jgi:hypothetical protein
MGTHTYLLEVIKIPKETTDYEGIITFKQFNDKYETNSNITRLYQPGEYSGDEIVTRNYQIFSCREVLARSLSQLFFEGGKRIVCNKETKCLVGIRALGETYTDVAKVIQASSGSASVSAFMSKLFKIPITLTYGFSSEKSTPQQFRPGGVLKLYGKEKKVNGHINMLLDLDEFDSTTNLHIVISTILALLRETRIISGILSGEIKTLKTLIRELYKISKDRAYGKESSYDCWALGVDTEDELSHSNNADGSDYYSIAKLALFIVAYCKKEITQNEPGRSGPVYYMENRGVDFNKSIADITQKWGLDFRTLLENKAAETEEEDDDEDSFFDDDEEDDE